MDNRVFIKCKRVVGMACLWAVAAAVQAVTVTYSLTTHVDGRTMTEANTQTAGAALSLPKAMIRGYTTYTYYADEAMAQVITTVPAEDATVYVDYEFDPPFMLSTDEYPVRYLFFCGGTVSTWGKVNNQNGKITESSTNYWWKFYGDGYSLNIKSSSSTSTYDNKYLAWSADEKSRSMSSEPEPIGWQLLENTDTEDIPSAAPRFSLGTYDEGTNNGKYFMYYDTSSGNTDKTITTNSKNQATSRATTCYVVMEGASNAYHYLTYKIIQDYPKYVQRAQVTAPLKNTVKAASPGNSSSGAKDAQKSLDAIYDTDIFDYHYYKDAAMTQEYGANEYVAPDASKSVTATKNVTVWVKESYKEGHEMQYVTDRWITICLPYGVADVADYFGEGAVSVEKFAGLEVTGNQYQLLFTRTNTILPNTPYLFKANNVLDGKYLTLYKTVAPPKDEEVPEDELHLSIDYDDGGTTVSMRGTFDGVTLSYDADRSQFFMGYKTADTDEQPMFYRISTKRNVDIQPFRCWFEITDQEGNAQSKSLSLLASTPTGVPVEILPDGSERLSDNVYNLQGQLVQANRQGVDGLPKGIYIVNGKKVVVR